MNIHFIRAAIESAIGIRLSLEQVRDYLLEEKMITPSKAKSIIFRGYGDFYGDVREEKEYTPKDLVQIIESGNE